MRVLASDLLNLFCILGETRRNTNEEQGLMMEDVLKGFVFSLHPIECFPYEGERASLMEVSQAPLHL